MLANKKTQIFLILVINGIFLFLHPLVFGGFEKAILSPYKTYIINAVATIMICLAMDVLKKEYEQNIGFIFMGFSVVKMIAFFLLINPVNSETDTTSKIDAITFFIPYALNMILEVMYLVKTLKLSS